MVYTEVLKTSAEKLKGSSPFGSIMEFDEFDEIGKEVDKYLAIDFTSESYYEVAELIPRGWKSVVGEELARLYSMYGDEVKIPILDPPPYYTIKLEMGLLRILAHCDLDKVYVSLWEMVSQQTARKTALVCMLCGKKAYRRKREEGMPCLCKLHYVAFVNYLADKSEV